jgi:hypothetical protein
MVAGKNPAETGVTGEVRQDRFVGGQDLTRWDTRPGRFLASVVKRISSLLGSHAALVLTLAVGAVLAVSLAAVFAQVYESVVEADGVAGLDHPVLDGAKTLRSPTLNLIITAYTDVGGTIGMPVLALAVMTLLAWRRRSLTPVILMLVAGLGSLLMTIAGKELVGRTRPDLADAVPPYEYSASFPSGHSLNSVVIAGIVAYLMCWEPGRWEPPGCRWSSPPTASTSPPGCTRPDRENPRNRILEGPVRTLLMGE